MINVSHEGRAGRCKSYCNGRVASQLVQRQTTLEAGYTLFGRLANLSLVNFMR